MNLLWMISAIELVLKLLHDKHSRFVVVARGLGVPACCGVRFALLQQRD
jgi:hypothetical protein